MMLPRKRQRPNPAEASSTSLPTTALSPSNTSPSQAEASGPPEQRPMPPSNPPSRSDTTPAAPNGLKQLRKTKSWYDSWPRTPTKATASTSVARENIFGGSVKSGRTPDLSRFDSRKEGDSGSVISASGTASGLLSVPEHGRGPNDTGGMGTDGTGTTSETPTGPQKDAEDVPMADAEAEDTAATDQTAQEPSSPPRPATSSGWLGWLGRTPFTETQVLPERLKTATTPAKEVEVEAPRPSTPPAQTAQTAPSDPPADEPPQAPPPSASWFGFWPSNNPTTMKPETGEEAKPAERPEDVDMKDAPPSSTETHQPAPTAGSTWAFWSKDSPKTKDKAVEPESGEIAVIGEGSEQRPSPMVEDDVTGSPSKSAKPQAVGRSTWRKNKRLRPPSMDIEPQTPSRGSSPAPTTDQIPGSTPQDAQAAQKVDSSSKSIAESETSVKGPANLLLPSFSSTYQMKENPSILKQITQFLLRNSEPAANHVFRVKDPPKIRKAIAIGVHGLFPATYLRPMIGQPTGTSLRFAGLCAEAIRRWTEANGCADCEIEKVALEGEGKINERVDNLWKLMLNWIDHIRSADLIVIASHSQGVPVGIMLLDKLIDLGIITNAKIGVCAMAGVSLGPFPEYNSSILMGSAAELWDFAKPETSNAQRFEASLKRVLEHGARITFIGSIDDQVVPMESAVYSPANHPFIYRAVFIDGRTHAPDFIAHLVGFALKLRNLGVSDHGLIRELSMPLAGSLYSGEGHSRIYFDAAVYDLAISHALETASATLVSPPCEVRHRGNDAVGAAPNPYVLPWIMRGMLEEDFVRTELSSEAEELLRQFDDWKPTNKALKDVKYRLEAVRSKL